MLIHAQCTQCGRIVTTKLMPQCVEKLKNKAFFVLLSQYMCYPTTTVLLV